MVSTLYPSKAALKMTPRISFIDFVTFIPVSGDGTSRRLSPRRSTLTYNLLPARLQQARMRVQTIPVLQPRRHCTLPVTRVLTG